MRMFTVSAAIVTEVVEVVFVDIARGIASVLRESMTYLFLMVAMYFYINLCYKMSSLAS